MSWLAKRTTSCGILTCRLPLSLTFGERRNEALPGPGWSKPQQGWAVLLCAGQCHPDSTWRTTPGLHVRAPPFVQQRDCQRHVRSITLRPSGSKRRAGTPRLAIVAQEVRRLATSTSQAVDLIQRVSERSMTDVHGGEAAAAELVSAIRSIHDGAGDVSARMGELAQSVAEQRRAMQEIEQSVLRMSEATAQNTLLVADTAAAAAALGDEATHLKHTAQVFSLQRELSLTP